jgi:hypothetical protein
MSNINLPPSSNHAPKPELLTGQSLIQERLRQACLSFNLALVLTAASGLVSIAGVVLLFQEKFPKEQSQRLGGWRQILLVCVA